MENPQASSSRSEARARAREAIETLTTDDRSRLASLPHPNHWLAQDGHTALDWVDEVDPDDAPGFVEERIKDAVELLSSCSSS